MECLGPRCAAMLLDWLKAQRDSPDEAAASSASSASGRQGLLWSSVAYRDDAATIGSDAELAGAIEHLEYAVFRRYQNTLTKAERLRLDNTIQNALFKIDRYVGRLDEADRARVEDDCRSIRERVRDGKEHADKIRQQGRRAELKLSQLASLTPEGFEEFVGEIFEALGFEVEHVGGSGDEGVDLKVRRGGLNGIVQCKYFSRGVVGSPELQKFLGTIHHTRSHKGYFVTTRTFTLAADKFAVDHPIELIDGPRLVELVQEAMGPGARKEPEPAWF
ncbi:restriction endonuclease [Tundrisphaera lichenicola]|uniref:restriction endonuclease n=1 Tax=Tundrisphaera lichenicola TaxID=2029860 RepID=UPI003EC01BC6